jgi:hypothetical protein
VGADAPSHTGEEVKEHLTMSLDVSVAESDALSGQRSDINPRSILRDERVECPTRQVTGERLGSKHTQHKLTPSRQIVKDC